MAETILQKHVLDYFRGVDQEDLPLILTTLCQDCLFSVETHGIVLKGHQEISGMFQRLWSEHKWVRHDQFSCRKCNECRNCYPVQSHQYAKNGSPGL